jgi:hypothetical protein
MSKVRDDYTSIRRFLTATVRLRPRHNMYHVISLKRRLETSFFSLPSDVCDRITSYFNTFFPEKRTRSEPLDRRAYILQSLMQGNP